MEPAQSVPVPGKNTTKIVVDIIFHLGNPDNLSFTPSFLLLAVRVFLQHVQRLLEGV